MSEALDAVKKDLQNIIPVVVEYEGYLKPYKTDLKVEGKPIDKANVEQASLLYYYHERHIELKSVVRYLEDLVEAVRGKLWIKYTETYNRTLQQKDKEHYITQEPEFQSMKALCDEVTELCQKYEAAVDAFRARGYVLNNLTRLIVQESQDHTL